MRIHRTRERAAAALACTTVVALVLLGVLVSRAARPKPPLCPDGRYLVQGEAILNGIAPVPAPAFTIDDEQITLDGACPATTVTLKAKRKGTSVKAVWPLCDGVTGPVRLKGLVEATCQTFTGKVRAKKARYKRAVEALRSTCGDGLVDPAVDEECESDAQCTPPETCTACECDEQQPTTTRVPGSSTTSVTGPTLTTSTTLVTTTTSTSTTLPTTPGPDPATVAPSLDPGATTGFGAATSFLFAGANPVQFNVAAGAIDPIRAAVIRGRVLDNAGAPLGDVLIRIKDHPEFGQGLSRADGAFDMAVNGGGLLTLDYQASGFLPAQRQVTVPWQDYVTAPDVMLCPLDAEATQVDLATATDLTIHRGSEKTDTDGTRQATLLVEPGTTAEMVMPDGSTEPLSQLTLRATEYTVGDAGPEMMPAALPPTSAYTYAVEFSADEALQHGASSVRFDRPIPTYVENFLDFPSGTPVPAGYYDREKGAWVAAPNGRVIDVVSVTGALADLDVTGDGTADTGTALTDLGIDDAEREKLATLYAPGQSLWRVPVDHFTAWDYNWPYGPPGDAVSPEDAGASASSDDEPIDGSCEESGSVFECENQVLGEDIQVAGTPYTLHYRSDRVPGRLDSLDVVLSGASVPASLSGIRVRATVAGQEFDQTFSPGPNQSVAITWNGLDAYARPVQGGQRVRGAIEYVYPAVYKTGAEFAVAFANFGVNELSANRSAATVTATLPFEAALREGITDARGLGLGGWTLGVQHFYDPATRVLHLGSGERRRAESVARVIDRATIPVLPDNSGTGIVFGPDKSLYTIHYGGSGTADTVVRRLFPDGTQVIVAGGGNQNTPPHGENGPAVGATIFSPNAPAIGPDGSLYLMDGSRVILRVGPDGIIRRVAGTTRFSNVGTPCPSGTALPEGVVATETDLCMDSFALAVAPDGSIYFIERIGNFERVKRIGPDGLITTVAGNGASACPTFGSDQCGDGGPALAARFFSINHSLALGPDGGVYVSDSLAIRRIGPDGIIDRFAGQRRAQGIFGDGGLATDALFCGPTRLATGPDGALYVSDGGRQIRRIARGIITRVAGSGTSCGDFPPHSGDGGPALQATMSNSLGLAVAPDDEIFVGSFGTNSVLRRIGQPLPGFTDTDITVASEDGRLLYAFDPSGRHIRTLDALTGAVRREFGYDAEGRLATVTERTGGTDNVTTIERDAAGNPTAIVGPFGKRTTLATDPNGFLASVTNPAGETTTLASTASGLLTSFTRPGNRTSAFTYDAAGRLLLDEDAVDGSQALVRTGPPNTFTVTRSTALGRDTTYQVESLPDRTQRRTVTAPDGTQGTSVENLDAATRQTTAPDGTQMTIVAGGDPRFGVAVPVATSVSVRLPGGLTANAANARTATLANPFDPLSLIQLTESSTVGGHTATTTYTAATRTFLTTTPLGRTRTLVLDALGRPATLQASGGVATTTQFDARGRLTSVTTGTGPDARQFAFTYDAQGLPATLTDPVGRSVSLERDAVGRVVRKILPGGDEIQLAYDAAGDLVGITPPGRPTHAFTYGSRRELLSVIPPAVPGSGATTFAYDQDGALTAINRPGESIAIGYDAAGRLDALDLAVQGGPQGTYAVTYDGPTGAVTQVTGPGGATLDYQHEGAVLTGINWGGPVTGSVAITLDDRLAVATESVNGETPIPFVHDDDDHLIGAGELAITRDATTGLPAATALGVVADTWVHDAFGELVDYEVTANGTLIYAEAFTYDALGRVVQKVESVGGGTDTLSYEYDPKGQLTTVRRDGVVVESYTYDANGNRGGATYDDQDRLLASGSTTFAYTPSGRLATRTTPGGTTSYTYDAAGNLLAVALADGTDVTYALDPAFRRVARDVDGVPAERFLWTGDRPIAQLDGSGALVSRFVYAGGTAPAYLVRGGVAHRLVTDQTGSVRLVVNTASGAVVQRFDYDAFGRVTLDTNPGFQPFGFAGGLYDPATGLVRLGARDYDAATGRWTFPDPLGFAGLDTNLYRYAGNDPVNLVDPSGLGTAGDIAAAVVAGLADVFFFAMAVPQAAANLGALASNAAGYPTPAPPDMNPIVGFLDAVNGVADTFFDAEPVVDTSSTAFGVTRLCAGLVGSLGANAAGNAARGAGAAGKAGNAIRPAMRPAVKNISRTADPNYRPAVEALKKQAERLAAEEKAQAASALQKAKEAVGRWLQNLGSEGRANPVNDSFKPMGGA